MAILFPTLPLTRSTLSDFTPDHALFRFDGPASGDGGRATAPAPTTDPGSLPAVDPVAQFNGVD